MKFFALLVIIQFALIIDSTTALRCFNCSLVVQFRCAQMVNLPRHHCPEPNMTAEEKETLGIYPICIKTTKPSLKPNSTHPYTSRTCGLFDGQKDNCAELIDKEYRTTGANLSCFTCTKELCNESNFLSNNIWLVLFAMSICVLVVKM